MILIADSGSTKTDWILSDGSKNINKFRTIGINPFFHTPNSIKDAIINSELQSIFETNVKEIFFYGAGCSTEVNCTIVKNGLLLLFPQAKIEINHDMLAAARALCGNQKSLAAILGTGSNTCLFDGTSVLNTIGGYGHILGDEGSGMHIGKTLLQNFMNDEMEESIHQKFIDQYKLSKKDVMDKVMKSQFPNRYMASFSTFLYENIDSKYCQQIIEKCFSDFFDKSILKYDEVFQLDLNIVGSIAYHFEGQLRKIAESKEVKIGKILRSPIEELSKFHSTLNVFISK
jgi:glucosamine kinase